MIRNLTSKQTEYESVFFDLDGTIADSGVGCMNALRYMFEQIGFAEPDLKSLKAFIGPSIKNRLQIVYGFSEKEALGAYEYYKAYYNSKGLFENRLYEGILDVLENIRGSGKAIYIATSKPEYQALRMLEHLHLQGVFSDVFAARHEEGIFEKDEVLKKAVSSLGGAPNSVMVGDRYCDILGGKHVGFDTVGVLYGYGELDELIEAGCDYIVDDPMDLSTLLGRG